MGKINNSYLEKDIKELDLENDLLNLLKENNINKVNDLWCLNRKKLKELGVKDNDIKLIIIKLQLFGLDLNKKVYR